MKRRKGRRKKERQRERKLCESKKAKAKFHLEELKDNFHFISTLFTRFIDL